MVALPLGGASPVKGLKRGLSVSAGQLLACHPHPSRGDIHASINGHLTEINELEIIISRDDDAVGEPPQPMPLLSFSKAELPSILKSLGLDLPAFSSPLLITTLDEEPGLTTASALWAEHRETLLAGVDVLNKLYEQSPIWAGRKEDFIPIENKVVPIKNTYPHTLPALIKKMITGRHDPTGSGVFGGRELFLLGRVWRTGLPATKTVLTLGTANYTVPVGARIIDLLTSANLVPTSGDVVIKGGLVRGTSLARLERGLAKQTPALHVMRRAVQKKYGPSFHQPRPLVSSCRRCGECEKACPAGLPIASWGQYEPEVWPRQGGPDGCFKCGCCALACPVGRLAAISYL